MSEKKVTYVVQEKEPTFAMCCGCQILNDICRALCRLYDAGAPGPAGCESRPTKNDDPDGEEYRHLKAWEKTPLDDGAALRLQVDLETSRMERLPYKKPCSKCGGAMTFWYGDGGQWRCGCGNVE